MLFIIDDGEGNFVVSDFIDVFDLVIVRFNGVGGEIDQFYIMFFEFGSEFGKGIEFGGVDGSVVFGVGEQDDLVVVNEFVEVDFVLGGFGLEVGGNGVKMEGGRVVYVCGIEV